VDATFSRLLPILPNQTIMVPGCEFSTSVTSTTFDNDDLIQCRHPTVALQRALDHLPGSKVLKLAGGTGINSGWFFQLPEGPALDCCGNPTDWYQILRDLSNDVPVEAPDYADCEVVNYNPGRDNPSGSATAPAVRTSPYFNGSPNAAPDIVNPYFDGNALVTG
jgi:hypothetical protein